MTFTWNCNEATAGTTLTTSIDAKKGDWILATITARSAFVISDGWQLLQTSTVLTQGSNQRMAFARRYVDETGIFEITVTQTDSARLYVNMIAFSGITTLEYRLGNEVFSNIGVKNISASRPDGEIIVWGCMANLWATSVPYGTWQCSDLSENSICLDQTKTQPRQANFIDTNRDTTERTFFSNDDSPRLVDCVILTPMTKKYLVQVGETLYTVSDGALVELETQTVSAETFLQHGVDDIPDGALFLGLTNPAVLYWQDSVEYPLPMLTATVTGTPPPQIVITDVQSMVDSTIKGIESALVEASEDVLFSISFDDGASWKAFNGSIWETVSSENAGMNRATFENIGLEEWAAVVTGSGYKIRFSLTAAESNLGKIVINYVN